MGSEVLLESPIAPNFSRTEATFLFSTVIGGAWGHFSPRSKTEHLRAWDHYFSAHEKPLAAVDHFFSAQTVSESFFVSDLLTRRCIFEDIRVGRTRHIQRRDEQRATTEVT